MSRPILQSIKRSQSYQEFFAFSIGGVAGTYIEIGAFKPVSKSNTYALETDQNWKGFSLELNQKYKAHWNECKERTNPVCWENAITFDYVSQINKMKLPNRINYLSCDIEPPANTFAALQRVIEQGVEFDCITYEHDNFANPSGPDYNIIATEYLESKGYKVAVTDVYASGNTKAIFETWFVKDTIDFDTTSYAAWLTSTGASQEKR
jgi:hypothetical protein